MGARFKGTNRATSSPLSRTGWVLAVKGRSGATGSSPRSTAGTHLTEAFEVVNDVPWYVSLGERLPMRIEDRKRDLVAGMEQTLPRIKAAAERSG